MRTFEFTIRHISLSFLITPRRVRLSLMMFSRIQSIKSAIHYDINNSNKIISFRGVVFNRVKSHDGMRLSTLLPCVYLLV